jgi:hypothetical protein
MAANPVILYGSLAVAAILLASAFIPVPCGAEGGWNMNQKIKADSTFGYIIDFNKDVTYKVTVRVTSGPNIDVGIFTTEEYFKLKNGEPAVAITGCAVYNVANDTLNCALEKGSYNIAFDNSDWGEAKSQGQDVIFDYQLVEMYLPGNDGGGGGGGTSMYMTMVGLVIGIIVVVVVVIVAAVYLGTRKKPGQQAYPPPQQPQYIPPQYQPPQQPPPQYPPNG